MRDAHVGGGGPGAPLLAAAAALCLLLSGCSGLPQAREMGDMALLRTMGVDASAAGVAVTGSTGPRARGLQAEGEPALVLAADRASLSAACLAMQGQSDSYVFFGYVDQLLVGEALAKEGVRPVLDYFARDRELGLGAQLWLVRGAEARQAVTSGGEEGLDRRLETLRHDGDMGIASVARTAGEVYTDLLEQGCAFVPALALSGGEGPLVQGGYGILRGEELAGFLEGEEARGLELLFGGPCGHVLDLALGDEGTAVRVLSARTKSSLELRGEDLIALKVDCKVEARLTEYRDPPGEGELERIGSLVEARERARIEGALERLRSWGTDCTGLGAEAAMARPAQWQALREDWPARFAQVPIEIQVEVRIR